eukprot:363301-Chlamydomonas_euryale.AAC.3
MQRVAVRKAQPRVKACVVPAGTASVMPGPAPVHACPALAAPVSAGGAMQLRIGGAYWWRGHLQTTHALSHMDVG